jgi:hypothetical protein
MEAQRRMNESKTRWNHRARHFKRARQFCRAKGLKVPEACPEKRIGKAPRGDKGSRNRGIYYAFCTATYSCSCQSSFPKVLRIPINKGKVR